MRRQDVDEFINFTYQDPEEGVCHIMTAAVNAGTIAYLTDRASTSRARIRITTIAFSPLQEDQQATQATLLLASGKAFGSRMLPAFREHCFIGEPIRPPLGTRRERGNNHRRHVQA